jgi:hypothetical protein
MDEICISLIKHFFYKNVAVLKKVFKKMLRKAEKKNPSKKRVRNEKKFTYF